MNLHEFSLPWRIQTSLIWLTGQDESLILVAWASSHIHDVRCQGNQNHRFCLLCRGPKPMMCLAGQATSFFLIALASSQIYIAHTKSQISLAWASYHINDFVCQGKQNHRFVLPSRAQKSVLWIARALKINDFGRPGGLPNARFCMPRQAQSLILLA